MNQFFNQSSFESRYHATSAYKNHILNSIKSTVNIHLEFRSNLPLIKSLGLYRLGCLQLKGQSRFRRLGLWFGRKWRVEGSWDLIVWKGFWFLVLKISVFRSFHHLGMMMIVLLLKLYLFWPWCLQLDQCLTLIVTPNHLGQDHYPHINVCKFLDQSSLIHTQKFSNQLL